MNTLDWLLIIPFAYFAIRGFMKGLIVEIFTLLALLCGIIGSMKLTNHFLPYLETIHQDSVLFVYLSYLISFLIIFLLVHLVGKVVEKVMKITALNFFNRLAGAALGLFKAAFMTSIVFWLSEQTNFLTENFKSASLSYDLLHSFAPALIDFITNHMPYFQELIGQVEIYFEKILEKVSLKKNP